MSNIRYEYLVSGMYEEGVPVTEIAFSREDARNIKREFKTVYGCQNAVIVQRKYILAQQQEVR